MRAGEVPGDGADVHDLDSDPGWTIGDRPHGGYLLAVLARAAGATVAAVEGPAHPYVLAASAQYISSPAPGKAEVRVEVLRRGRGFSQARARLVKDGFVRVEANFTLGRLRADAEPWWNDTDPPQATPFEDCPSLTTVGSGVMSLGLMDKIDLRLDPAVVDFARAEHTGKAEHWGWLALADGSDHDPLSLLLAVDALPPATIGLGTLGWVPTLSLTAYVRALPAPGPLLVRIRANLVEDDMVDEICDAWDSRGRLVARATQLAAVRTTSSTTSA
jgi:hypothetical protein